MGKHHKKISATDKLQLKLLRYLRLKRVNNLILFLQEYVVVHELTVCSNNLIYKVLKLFLLTIQLHLGVYSLLQCQVVECIFL